MPPEHDGGATGGGRAGGGAGGGGGTATGGGTEGSGTGGGTGGGSTGGSGGGNTGGSAGGGTAQVCTPGESRACCGTGLQACDSTGQWLACSQPPAPERCNGQIDDDVSFGPGELADAGAELDGGCSVGVGACLRTGSLVCGAAGAASCGATAGAPDVETCNAIDDDCDGQVDEGVQVACLVDSDDDHYANDTTTTVMACPDSSRASFGGCPPGLVAASASLGTDCAPTDATRFAPQQARVDSDNDGACVQAAMTVCSGTTLPVGYRAPSSCSSADDCNDTDATAFRTETVRTDADNDTYCVGGLRSLCIGATTPSGTRLASACDTLIADCDDSTASKYRTLSVRSDADNDGYCSASPASSQCTGVAPQPGFRLATGCNAENDCDETTSSKYRLATLYPDADGDQHCVNTATPTCVGAVAIAPGYLDVNLCLDLTECDDTNNTLYRMAAMRRDQDNDGYCGSTLVTNLCVGTNAPSGYRFTCPATLDCRDSNPNATTSCTQSVLSDQQSKYCGSQPATETLTFHYSCPTGFFATAAAAARQYSNCVDGACTSANAFTFGNSGTTQAVSFTCDFAAVGHDDWKLSVTCTAL